jgi:hypothetical protein
MKRIYEKRPFKIRNADEYDLKQILSLFVNPLTGLTSPFEFENNIVKGRMGSGKTMFLRANHAYHLYNLVPRIIENTELILPVFIRLSDFQHIKEPSKIYNAIIIKIVEELSSIYLHLQDAKKMAKIHQGIQGLPNVLLSEAKLSNTLSQLSRLVSEEYFERISSELGIGGGAKARFLELSAKYSMEHLQEFKKKANPGVKDIEEAYKNLIEDQEGRILLLIDEAGSLDRQFFKGLNNDSFFEILMNQFRTASYIRTKIAIYPDSYQDILTETRYGDVLKLEEKIFSPEGYKSFRKKSISLITNYLSVDEEEDYIPASKIFELKEKEEFGDCLEQLINGSDGNIRRLIHLLDAVMNVAYSEHNGSGNINLDHAMSALKDHSHQSEDLYTQPDQEFLSNIQQVCKARGTYKFQFPNMSIPLNKFTSRSQEHNLLKIIEIGTGSRGNTYAFDYCYCIAHDIPTHHIENSEKLSKDRSLLNGKWIARTAKISEELLKHAGIVNKINGTIDFNTEDAGIIKGNDGLIYYYSKQFIIEDDRSKPLYIGKEVRFIPVILGEGNLLAQGIEVL